MNPTPITRRREALTRRSFAAPSLPIVAKVGAGASAQAVARSQRELVQWSLMLRPERPERPKRPAR
jgi:hypothetical protein